MLLLPAIPLDISIPLRLLLEPIRSSLSAWEDEILLRQNPKGNAARKVGQKIPGFETSAAFFTSLRTNLRLSTSPPPSPTSTPPSLVNSATSLPPPSPLSFPAELPPPDTTSSLLHTPKLTTTLATTPAEKAAALALISASLTHKRTEATRALLLHPLNLTLLLLLLTLLYHSLPPTLSIPLTSILLSIPIPPYLYLAHHQTQPYATRASTLNPSFLTPTDEIFTTLLPAPPSPQRPIATLILRPQPLPNFKSKGNTPLSTAHRKSRNRPRYYQIRAWTVEPAYRRRGLGRKLLETAVETACRRGGEGVVFSSEQVFACAVAGDETPVGDFAGKFPDSR
ncbi:hypothetical protein MBLNU230_g2336t1 [Neophaeotheca triangularis]